ncbi:MAG: holo-ACP synthase [Propionibacteriaceae bacterium]|jgi:holo-[acyl-carrier protein] synthase|nr:holo-ACP synthase [Propionibacteriaceae bacterium]
MIVGIGVDMVSVARLAAALERHPGMARRVFAAAELVGQPSTESLAGSFAAKEALVKALGSATGGTLIDIAVTHDGDGAPSLTLNGAVRARAEERGVVRSHLSISHDGGMAIAMVVLEGAVPPPIEEV